MSLIKEALFALDVEGPRDRGLGHSLHDLDEVALSGELIGPMGGSTKDPLFSAPGAVHFEKQVLPEESFACEIHIDELAEVEGIESSLQLTLSEYSELIAQWLREVDVHRH
jgi:hypothetical protein